MSELAMIWLTGMALYLCIGAALGAVIDSDQMKKPVPYADAPSIFSLRRLRVACYVVYSLFWLPFVLDSMRIRTWNWLRCHWLMRRYPAPKIDFSGKPVATVMPAEKGASYERPAFHVVDDGEEFGGDKSKEGETHGS